MEITYDLIKPILLDSRVEESKMHCQFKCKGSDQIVRSTAVIQQKQTTKTKVITIVKDNVINEVKRTITNQLIRLVGGRVASTASSVAATAIDGSRKAIRFTPGEKKDAVVEAFKFVANQFHFDEHIDEWVMMNGLSEFEQYTIKRPVEEDYDRHVLAKLLTEMASLEDDLSMDELDFIQSLLPDENALALDSSENASQVELREVSVPARKTIFLIAVVVALLNREFSAAEQKRLKEVAVGLNVLEAEANALILIAQQYIVENVIATNSMNKEKLFALADRMHLSHDDAERTVINYSRRARG